MLNPLFVDRIRKHQTDSVSLKQSSLVPAINATLIEKEFEIAL